MTPDVVFLVGRASRRWWGAKRSRTGCAGCCRTHAIESHSEIEEIVVAATWPTAARRLSVTITSKHGNTPMQRSGRHAVDFAQGSDGKWRLTRDANMLARA